MHINITNTKTKKMEILCGICIQVEYEGIDDQILYLEIDCHSRQHEYARIFIPLESCRFCIQVEYVGIDNQKLYIHVYCHTM